MIEIGQLQQLRATRRAPPGVYLSDGDTEVLLPNRYVPEAMRLGDSLDVFVYTDSEDRPVATTQKPHVAVGGIACLTVVDVGPHGAFLDWGLDKDLFAPTSLQRLPMRKGERHVVAASLDERTGRVIATSRVERHTVPAPDDYAPDQSVALLVYHQSLLGAHVVVEGRYEGLVHASAVIGAAPRIGDELTGFVQRVRDDGKLDVSLKPPGRAAQEGDAQILLAALEAAGGSLPLHDKSPPEQIAAALSMSKKAFKKALGSLYRARLVNISEQGIRRVPAKGSAREK
jgi:predicted RNA-binding protein (virulence factor B family)